MRKSAPRIEHQGCDAPSWLTKVCTPEEIGFSHGYWRERDWALSQGLADGILTGDGLRQYIRRQELERAEVYRRHGSGSWEPRSFDYDLAESRRMLRAIEKKAVEPTFAALAAIRHALQARPPMTLADAGLLPTVSVRSGM